VEAARVTGWRPILMTCRFAFRSLGVFSAGDRAGGLVPRCAARWARRVFAGMLGVTLFGNLF